MDENNPNLPDEDLSLSLTPGKLLVMSIVSANIYLFISLMIIKYWHDGWLAEVFASEFSIWSQLGIGFAAGCFAAAIIYFLINRDLISSILSDYSIFEALTKAKFSLFDRAQVSAFAGAGEELLFRGAIQPLLGNTVTSIIFVGIHGYFKFKSPAHIFFGAMMFGLSFMLGLLSEQVGLVSAMMAHAAYDLVMLQAIQRKNRSHS